MVYVNLTQHDATDTQLQAGVIDLPDEIKKQVRTLITFEEVPGYRELRDAAKAVVLLVEPIFDKISADGETPIAMIGGAPFFMPVLADYIEDHLSVEAVYAFSKRRSTEVNGVKNSVFEHVGFVRHYSR